MTQDGRTHHAECWRDHIDCAVREVERLQAVQNACRERIYAVLCDDDLTDEDLRAFSEAALPEIHDALHQASGYAASECFTDGPAEKYLREKAEDEAALLRARQIHDELRDEARRLYVEPRRSDYETRLVVLLRRIAAIGEEKP